MYIFIILGVVIAIIGLIVLISSFSNRNMGKGLNEMANMVVRVHNNMVNENEDMLRESANRVADIKKDAVRTIAHSIKEGFSDEDNIYCKHCGQVIDSDSKFCKICGKEQ